MDPTLSPAPGRIPVCLSPRLTVVVLEPVPGVVVLGYFVDGELVYVDDGEDEDEHGQRGPAGGGKGQGAAPRTRAESAR